MTGLVVDAVIRRGDAFELDIAFEAPAGISVALLGPNGAGKSTVVDAIAGLIAITRGSISLGHRPLDAPGSSVWVPPEERRLGIVFQDALLFDHMSVLDNVAFGPRSSGLDTAESRRRAHEWLGRLGLADMTDRRPAGLSGGERQRVALARALAVEPEALLLDEPFSALDVGARHEVREVVREHLDAFTGPRILITHDPTEAFLLADRIHVVEHGAIVQAGSAEEIRLRPRTPFVAELAGINLVPGTISDGVVDTGTHRLVVVDEGLEGPVLATIHPTAIAIHRERPSGSPRNAWRTRIERLEQVGHRARVLVRDPLELTVEVTDRSIADLALAVGSEVWVAVKATEIMIESRTMS